MKLNRQYAIKDYLIEHNTATLTTLCTVFNVSINTIRSDISKLEKEGFLKKVYGGVVLNDNSPDSNQVKQYNPLSTTKVYEELDMIGKEAAKLIENNDIIYFCSGKTVHSVLNHINPDINFTIITNSLLIINSIMTIPNQNVKVLTTGGEFQKSTLSFVGIETLDFLKKINITKLIMSADGISIQNGITNICHFESEIKRILLSKNCKSILLANHNKFDKFSTFTILPLSSIDIVITNKEVSSDYNDFFIENDTKIIYPEYQS